MEMMMVHGRRDEQYGQHHHHHHHHLGLGLGLSLSLSLGVAGGAADEPPCRGVAPPPQQLCGWNGAAGLFSSSSDRRTMMACHDVEMPFLRGIDVNRAPVETTTARGASCSEEDEEPGASSPNSTLSSLSGKRGAPSAACRSEAATAAAGSDDEDSGGGGGSRKKLRLSKDQAAVLEDTFKEHNTLNPKQKAALARQLNLKPRQVEVWFQNRRARTKLKQTEVDCELLKRCCETLTDENRRLHRELQELRALKLAAAAAPHLYARVPPPTTLTMCPSCERIASTTHNSGAGEVVAPARPVPTRPWPAAAAQRSSA